MTEDEAGARSILFEEHGSVLAHWFDRGARDQTLLCFDAHLDIRPINERRLAPLREARSGADISSRMKLHPSQPDGDTSFGIEDFLYAAHRLGIIGRLIWVVPPFVGANYSEAALAALMQMDGVDFEQLLTFHRGEAGCIQGSLLDLPITMCSIEQLAELDLPADLLVDIDVDYLIGLPEDRPWCSPNALIGALQALSITPQDLTISRSVSSGYTPLRYRFLGDHLAALWDGDDKLAGHYTRLFLLDHRAGEDSILTELGSELAAFPDCPATHFLAGCVATASEAQRRHQESAAGQNVAYADDLLRSISEFRARGLPIDAAMVDGLVTGMSQIENDDHRASAHAAIGLIYCAGSQLEMARTHFDACRSAWGGHPELGLEIAKGMLPTSSIDELSPYLDVAEDDDETRTAAGFLRGCSLVAGGDAAVAIPHLETARQRAPAWLEIMAVLSDAQELGGDREAAGRLRQELQLRREQMVELAQRLS